MKISASYWIFDGGLDGTLQISSAMEQARGLGFDGIELGIASKGVLTHQTTKEECEEIVREAEKQGLEISGVASGESWTSSPTSSDDKVRETILDFTQKALQVTQWLVLTRICMFQAQWKFSFCLKLKSFLMMFVLKGQAKQSPSLYLLQKNLEWQLL